MPQEQNLITVKFKAAGDKALTRAINQLAAAQARLERSQARITAGGKKLNEETGKYSNQMQLLGGKLSVVRSKLLVLSFGFTLVAGSVGKLVKLFGEQEKAQRKLSIQLGGTSKDLLEFASSMQKVTRFGDEVTISAMATAAAYTKDEEELKKVTKAAMDYAEFAGKDLNQAVLDVSKSIFSSTNLLSRQGIAFNGTVGTAERFENALKAIDERAGGLAVGNAKTLLGALEQTSNALGDLGENLGSLFVPLVNAMAIAVKALAEHFDKEKVESYAASIVILGVAYGITTGKITQAIKAIKAMNLATAKGAKGLKIMLAVIAGAELIDYVRNLLSAKEVQEDFDSKTIAGTKEAMLARQAYNLAVLETSLLTDDPSMVEHWRNILDIEDKRAIVSQKMTDLKDLENAGFITHEEHMIRLLELQKQFISLDEQEEKNRIKKIKGYGTMASALAGLNESFKGSVKATARLQQAAALIDAYAAAQSQYMQVSKILPPPATQIAYADAIIQGISQARAISSSIGDKFEQGGLVGGRRHSQGGTMIEAEQGEFVMSRNAVQAVGLEAMNRINEGGGAGGITVNVSGNVLTQDFVEGDLADAIREATRRGVAFS